MSTPTTTTLAPTAPNTLATDDALMGSQLTEQYHRATGAMAEILKFGAMMMVLREKLSALGQLRAGRLAKDSDPGVSAWLKQHAPEINKSTAYRFLHVTEAVARDFALPKQVSFIELATKPAADLPEPLRATQAELWDFVSGTSQRSWLDRFAPAGKSSSGGGSSSLPPKLPPKLDPEALHARLREECKGIFNQMIFVLEDERWHALSDEELRLAVDLCNKFTTAAKAHLATPRADRLAAAWQKAA